MSDAARLARQALSSKPAGMPYVHFEPGVAHLSTIGATVNDAVSDSAYAAAVSYVEALSGLGNGSISWSIVRLYYSCFYSIRALLLLNNVVPFNCGEEMLLDISNAKFLKGGRSSHHWNWVSIRRISRIASNWFFSEDSQESYEKLREHRENVNYTHTFTDPIFHQCLLSGDVDLAKRFRSYRDDGAFLYTYLVDHLAIAYPTKLIFALDASMQRASIELEPEKIAHIKKIWSFKDRCPMT